MSSDRIEARRQLRRDVALMRKLGVARWTRGEHDVFLGPPPADTAPMERTPEDIIARIKREEQQRHDVLFAASPIRPVNPASDRVQSVKRALTPEIVAPRQSAHAGGGGGGR